MPDRRDAAAERRRLAPVRLPQDPHGVEPQAGDDAGGVVVRAVVDDDHLELLIITRRDRTHTPLDRHALVEGGHHHAHRRLERALDGRAAHAAHVPPGERREDPGSHHRERGGRCEQDGEDRGYHSSYRETGREQVPAEALHGGRRRLDDGRAGADQASHGREAVATGPQRRHQALNRAHRLAAVAPSVVHEHDRTPPAARGSSPNDGARPRPAPIARVDRRQHDGETAARERRVRAALGRRDRQRR